MSVVSQGYPLQIKVDGSRYWVVGWKQRDPESCTWDPIAVSADQADEGASCYDDDSPFRVVVPGVS